MTKVKNDQNSQSFDFASPEEVQELIERNKKIAETQTFEVKEPAQETQEVKESLDFQKPKNEEEFVNLWKEKYFQLLKIHRDFVDHSILLFSGEYQDE